MDQAAASSDVHDLESKLLYAVAVSTDAVTMKHSQVVVGSAPADQSAVSAAGLQTAASSSLPPLMPPANSV